ncbi:short chain dehydrogenase (plasmid) [Azospirillum humicireducens]|uniref:Short chain dehydrogenase n=1 Tax=Azospirillum humicireducens TaxID=1226968 RepID=A0A2R4VV34_9PROT|nr:SDR family oxidoreductase [Azospirillum humicireducens]AWB08251.1 short chain dehydrogenase [Azospirillum humicireducens]
MAKRPDDRIGDKVVVITGASSGIGRATALEFARQGAAVVLAARRMAALHEVAEDCVAAGGRAMVVPTDVTDRRAMQHLADRAIEAFGGIDIWVNNAGVIAFGRFEDIPDDVFEQVVRTDFFGTVHGCRAVLPHFLDRGEGIVINTASMVSNIGQRYATPYTAAKFAVRGFTESLRQELVDEPGIHVCMVMPASIDTPLWQHAANYTGRAVKPLTPIHPPEEVAAAILALARNPERERFVGTEARIAAVSNAMAPQLTERALAHTIERDMFQNRSAPATSGGVMTAMPEHQGASGGWIEPEPPRRPFSWTNLTLFLLPVVLASRPLGNGGARHVW